jgi:hypothetical protein
LKIFQKLTVSQCKILNTNFIYDSNKYYQANTAGYLKQTKNKQMIMNTKIMQSQSYQNGALCERKRERIFLNIKI